MNLLVDTHVLLWFLKNSPELPDQNRVILDDAENTLFLSAACLFEISTKSRIGKLVLPPRYQMSLLHIFDDLDFQPMDITPAHCDLAGRMAGEHKDPWDRMLAAQSIIEDMSVMTADRQIGVLGAKVVW